MLNILAATIFVVLIVAATTARNTCTGSHRTTSDKIFRLFPPVEFYIVAGLTLIARGLPVIAGIFSRRACDTSFIPLSMTGFVLAVRTLEAHTTPRRMISVMFQSAPNTVLSSWTCAAVCTEAALVVMAMGSELTDWTMDHAHASYKHFNIFSEADGYR